MLAFEKNEEENEVIATTKTLEELKKVLEIG
jgi:hypothetical protein